MDFFLLEKEDEKRIFQNGSRILKRKSASGTELDLDWIPNNQESQLFLLIGRLTTFNFNNDVNSAHLHSQDYAICIRREVGKKWIKPSQFNHNIKCKIVPGNCCIEYSVCEDPNSFSIDNTRD